MQEVAEGCYAVKAPYTFMVNITMAQTSHSIIKLCLFLLILFLKHNSNQQIKSCMLFVHSSCLCKKLQPSRHRNLQNEGKIAQLVVVS